MYLKLFGAYEKVYRISDSISTCICWDLVMKLYVMFLNLYSMAQIQFICVKYDI
jgi:hypothetical protein